jgi:hypothetical protein
MISIKTCLEGRNLVNLTMHAPWCITGCPSNIFYQTTCKGQPWGQPRPCFAGISWRLVRRGSMEVTQSEIVTTPPEIIPYYFLNHSIWSLSDNKEVSRWVLPG